MKQSRASIKNRTPEKKSATERERIHKENRIVREMERRYGRNIERIGYHRKVAERFYKIFSI